MKGVKLSVAVKYAKRSRRHPKPTIRNRHKFKVPKRVGFESRLYDRLEYSQYTDHYLKQYGHLGHKMKIWWQLSSKVELGFNHGTDLSGYNRYTRLHIWRPWTNKPFFNPNARRRSIPVVKG